MEQKSIKKSLPRISCILILVLIVLLTPINLIFQLTTLYHYQQENSEQLFGEIIQTIENDKADLEEEKERFAQLCIQRAELAAYFVRYDPTIDQSLARTLVLAKKMDVDEIHFFNTTGTIYAGTHPAYYGYSVHSGEQMKFFEPMIHDTSLKLCQDIMPNTAEGKEMQYAAVWMEDQRGFVQIGMRPERLLAEIKEKSLRNVIANVLFDFDGHFYIVNKKSGRVIASTRSAMIGESKSAIESSFHLGSFSGIYHLLHGEKYCVFTKDYGDYTLIRTYLPKNLINRVLVPMIMLLIYILVAASSVLILLYWYVSKHILKNIVRLNNELTAVKNGKLDSLNSNTNLLEFDILINYINQLLKTVRFDAERLVDIIDAGQISLGIYEYNNFTKRSFWNQWMIEILKIDTEQFSDREALNTEIGRRLQQIESNPVDTAQMVYYFEHHGEMIYVKMQKKSDHQTTICYLSDISSWWSEIENAKVESHRDSLTGLLNRRGIQAFLKENLLPSEDLRHAAVILLDADDLKRINDRYGHQTGDEYLKEIARICDCLPCEHHRMARLGGDEFIIVLYGYGSSEELEEAIEGVRRKRGIPFGGTFGEIEEHLEFSMGCAYYGQDSEDYQKLMSLADERMYQEKRERKKF